MHYKTPWAQGSASCITRCTKLPLHTAEPVTAPESLIASQAQEAGAAVPHASSACCCCCCMYIIHCINHAEKPVDDDGDCLGSGRRQTCLPFWGSNYSPFSRCRLCAAPARSLAPAAPPPPHGLFELAIGFFMYLLHRFCNLISV